MTKHFSTKRLTKAGTLDWASACEELEPSGLQALIEMYSFDIINDFDEKSKESFIQSLKDKEALEYVHHLHFAPVFPKESWFEGCPWYGALDFEEILSALILVKENCPNVETMEVEYESSFENIEDDDACFDLFVEWFQSFESLKKVDFTFVEHQGIHQLGSVLNTLPKCPKSFVSVLTRPLQKSKKIGQEIVHLPEKFQDDVLYHLNLIYSDSSSINSDYVPIAIRKESSGSNNKKVIAYDIHQHEKFISNLNGFLAVLGPYLAGLCIDCRNTSYNFSFDEESHIKHIYNTCYNLENLKIAQTEEGYHRHHNEFGTLYVSIESRPIKPLLSLIGARSFGVYMSNLSEFDVKYLHINNNAFGPIMKQLSINQKDSDVHHLNLIYSHDHSNAYTSIDICKKKSGNDSSKRVITYNVHQNEELISLNENALLADLGPYLDTLYIDIQRTSPGLSFDSKHIYTTCNKLRSLEIKPPKNHYSELTINSSNQSTLIRFGTCLSNISKLNINNICVKNEGFASMMKPFSKIQDNDIHNLNLTYYPNHSSNYTSIDIYTTEPEDDSSKRIITYNVRQNEEFINYTNEILAALGPCLTKLNIYFKKINGSFFYNDSFNKATYMEHIYSNCHNLKTLVIKAPPNCCHSTMFGKTKKSNIELSNYIASYLASIPEFFIENFYSIISGEDSDILKFFAEKEKNKIAPPILELKYFNDIQKMDQYSLVIDRREQLGIEMSPTTYRVLLSTTSRSTDKVLQALGPYTVLPDIDMSACSNSRYQLRKLEYTAYSLSRISHNLKENNSPKHEQNIELQNNIRVDYFNENGLKALKDWAEKEDENTTHCLNLIYCDGKHKDLNSIRVTKRLDSGQTEDGSKSSTITYNVRLDEATAYNTTKTILTAVGGYLTYLDIHFEEESVQRFYFDEKEYLNEITKQCKVIKNLKIRNFPQTREEKHNLSKKFILCVKTELNKPWFYGDELEKDVLSEIATKLARTHLEIKQYPLSETMISLEEGLKDHTPLLMTVARFDDMITCFESVGFTELSQPYCPESTPPGYEQPTDTLPAYIE